MPTINSNDRVLKLLKRANGYLSGEAIAQHLNISRSAVWKKIEKLRAQGFFIDAQPKLGYCIRALPDKLLPLEIKDGLDTTVFGQQVFYYSTISSTNFIAKQLASEGAAEGSVVIAEEQTKGRGRLDRHWISPAGKNILMSVIFYPKLLPSQVFCLTMMTSLAIIKAIETTVALSPMIKWPNDIYLNGKKTGGILTEFNAQQDRVNFVITGIGLNVNFDPFNYPDIRDIGTSLSKESGKEISRIKLLQFILKEIEKGYTLINDGKFDLIYNQWKPYSLVTGKPVRITSFNSVEDGIAESVDENGALVLRDKYGNVKKIVCGDVSLRLNFPT
jgi:BirA family biotin operon repressor/biotin-[acetyl-CoA-carboxylase] ligase